VTRIHHQAGLARAIFALLALAALIACAGCADNGQTYDETERGVCAATGQGSETSWNRHGPVTRCALPE
jgi:hypothetical protein